MNSKNKKTLIIALFGLVVGLAVGYAALQATLTINGTAQLPSQDGWNVHILEITETSVVDATTSQVGKQNETTASFTVDLKKPGSSATYTVKVKNDGDINAVLDSIEGVDTANGAAPTDIKFSVDGINANDTLDAGAEKSFTVKAEWLGTATTIPQQSKTLTLKLNYVQATS